MIFFLALSETYFLLYFFVEYVCGVLLRFFSFHIQFIVVSEMLVASSLRLLFIWLFMAPIFDEICIYEIIIDTLTSVGHLATYDFVVLALDILIRLLTDRWPESQ